MPLPSFRSDTWLPAGHHPTTWQEIVEVFGGEPGSRRASVLAALLEWHDRMQNKGITGLLILNGSFISSKLAPGDFDAILVLDEAMEKLLAKDAAACLLVDYTYCKQQGWGDIFVFSEVACRKFPHLCRTDGLDYDKETKQPKGVVEVRL